MVGLSDGISIEIKSGIDSTARVRGGIQNNMMGMKKN
jgi:hypothetical protein